MPQFAIAPDQLLLDLYRAYKDARRHKRGKAYQLAFEMHLEDNLVRLRDELLSGAYKPGPSTCFIIHDPKMREVFAADFRDRIVHHLYYNYTHRLLERTFIHDCYSCIPGRGTHFGIRRLEHHIRSVSHNWTRPCYVLKLDIRGYFMSIDRQRLFMLCRRSIAKMRKHASDVQGKTWEQLLDLPFVDYLLERIALADPTEDCRMLGRPSDWQGLPPEKSILHAEPGRGLPIGNLSSQLFSNVYLNVLDQWVKRTLGQRHYGRYVDDAYIVGPDRRELLALVPRIRAFLWEELGLRLHEGKVRVVDARHGVEFLGAYVRPHRTYVAHSTLRRMKRKLRSLPACIAREAQACGDAGSALRLQSAVNSLLGVLSHFRSLRLRRVLFGGPNGLGRFGRFSNDWLRFFPWGRYEDIPPALPPHFSLFSPSGNRLSGKAQCVAAESAMRDDGKRNA